eukprot:SAG11_NODE_716_length_7614_cov_63.924837_8_plen_111_part_00
MAESFDLKLCRAPVDGEFFGEVRQLEDAVVDRVDRCGEPPPRVLRTIGVQVHTEHAVWVQARSASRSSNPHIRACLIMELAGRAWGGTIYIMYKAQFGATLCIIYLICYV